MCRKPRRISLGRNLGTFSSRWRLRQYEGIQFVARFRAYRKSGEGEDCDVVILAESGEAIAITTLPLGEGRAPMVHYIRLTRTDLAP